MVGEYIVKVNFDKNNVKDYLCPTEDEVKKVVYAAKRFNLDYEVLKEHKGYQEVIYFLD